MPDELHRAIALLDAIRVALQGCRAFSRDRRFVEVEIDRIICAGGRRRRRLAYPGDAPSSLAFFILRAVIIFAALLGAFAGTTFAFATRTALIVGRAGLANAVDARLSGRASRIIGAGTGPFAAAFFAGLARGTIRRVAALLALAIHTVFFG